MIWLTRVALQYPWQTLMAAFILVGSGLVTAMRLPLDALPDIVSLEMEVNTQVDAFSPEEVEMQVTVPIERRLAGIPGLEAMRSTSQYGLSQIELIFRDDVSVIEARQLIIERLQAVHDLLPPDTYPLLAPVKSGLGEILYYSLDYDQGSVQKSRPRQDQLIALKRYQLYTLGPRLEAIPGVAEVSATGGFTPQMDIDVDAVKLVASGLAWSDLSNSLRRVSWRSGGGVLPFQNQQITLKSFCNLTDPRQVGDIQILSRSMPPILLKNVATVRWGTEMRAGAALINGQEGLLAAVVMQRGENARLISQRVMEILRESQAGLPEGMSLHVLYNRGDLIEATVRTIRHNLLMGAGTVLFILFALIGSWRAALIVAVTIPLAFFTSLLGLKLTSYSGNLISLGAVDFGLIIDGAVVIAENIVRHLNEECARRGRSVTRQERREIVLGATEEVARPVIFGVCIITLVYMPIFALTGVEGKMFQPLAVTLLFALTTSLFIALTLVPALCFLFLKDVSGVANRGLTVVKREYGRLLYQAIRFKSLIVASAMILVLLSVVCFTRLGGEFLPELNEGTVLLTIERPASLTLEASVEMQAQTEEILLRDFPEIMRTYSRVGSDDEAVDAVGANESDTFLEMRPASQWRTKDGHPMGKDELLDAMADDLNGKVPDQTLGFTQPVADRFNDFLEGERADLVVKIFGENFNELEKLGAQVCGLAKKVPGAQDVTFDLAGRNPTVEIHPMPDKLEALGISQAELNGDVIHSFAGEEVGMLLTDGYPVDALLRLPQIQRNSMMQLSLLPLRQVAGKTIRLGEVAQFEMHDQVNEIQRDAGHRRVAIVMNIRGRDLETFAHDLEMQIHERVLLPEGYTLYYGGHYRTFSSAQHRLLIMVPTMLIVILLLLIMACHSWSDALIIMTGAPFAFTGGALALYLRGLPLTIPAAIGFIALCGIAVLNGLVLVKCVRQISEREFTIATIIEGCGLRLRPVLMTALVGSLGFLPMAISKGTGAEIQLPLATVVIGGIVSSTLLTLVIVPIILAMRVRLTDKFSWGMEGR